METSTLRSLLDDPRYRDALLALATQNRRGMSAEEFVASFRFTSRVGANIGKEVGLRIGLRSATAGSFVLPLNPIFTCMSICTALVNSGTAITEILEREDRLEYAVFGTIPSSPLHWSGSIAASVTEHRGGAQIALNVIFPGQIFAWGAGSRLIEKVKQECLSLSQRVAAPMAAKEVHSSAPKLLK